MDDYIDVYKNEDLELLSNDHMNPIYIKVDKVWKSATHYIYANLLLDDKLTKEVKEIRNSKKVHSLVKHLQEKEQDNAIIKSMRIATHIKFQNKDILNELMNTSDRPIHYVSQSNLLGIGPFNEGSNQYGKLLESIRNSYRASRIKENKGKTIKNVYIAREIILRHVSEKEAIELLKLEPVQLIEAFIKMYDKNRLIVDRYMNSDHRLEKEAIELISKDVSSFGQYVTLEFLIKKRNKDIERIKNSLFEVYTKTVLRSSFPQLKNYQYDQAINEQLEYHGREKKREIKEKLYRLYSDGKFDENLLGEMEKASDSNYMDRSELTLVADLTKLKSNLFLFSGDSSFNSKTDPNKKPVLVYPLPSVIKGSNKYISFSPAYPSNMLLIDGLMFPTVSHYIIFRRIIFFKLLEVKNTSKEGKVNNMILKDSYNLIVTKPNPSNNKDFIFIQDAQNILDDLSNFVINNLKIRNTKFILNHKFNLVIDFSSIKDRSRRKQFKWRVINSQVARIKQLVMTRGLNIIWGYPKDYVLGYNFDREELEGGKFGEQIGGDNNVGKILEFLREKLISKQSETRRSVKEALEEQSYIDIKSSGYGNFDFENSSVTTDNESDSDSGSDSIMIDDDSDSGSGSIIIDDYSDSEDLNNLTKNIKNINLGEFYENTDLKDINSRMHDLTINDSTTNDLTTGDRSLKRKKRKKIKVGGL